MYLGLLHAHSIIRYITLILIIAVVVKSLIGWQNRQPFGKTEDKLSLFLFISVHTQLLIGLLLYFFSPLVNFSGMADKVYRYWSVEHAGLNLIAIALITVGRVRMKKISQNLPEAKHKVLFLFTAGALLLLIISLMMMPDRPFLGGKAVGI